MRHEDMMRLLFGANGNANPEAAYEPPKSTEEFFRFLADHSVTLSFVSREKVGLPDAIVIRMKAIRPDGEPCVVDGIFDRDGWLRERQNRPEEAFLNGLIDRMWGTFARLLKGKS